jgi:hypothetical protein
MYIFTYNNLPVVIFVGGAGKGPNFKFITGEPIGETHFEKSYLSHLWTDFDRD